MSGAAVAIVGSDFLDTHRPDQRCLLFTVSCVAMGGLVIFVLNKPTAGAYCR